MSLGKIVMLSVLLGVVVGALAGLVFGEAARPALVGAGVGFVSVIAAGLIQPPPKRVRRKLRD